jgi:hypothetical protein
MLVQPQPIALTALLHHLTLRDEMASAARLWLAVPPKGAAGICEIAVWTNDTEQKTFRIGNKMRYGVLAQKRAACMQYPAD